MTPSEEIYSIKHVLDRIEKAKGKEKLPILSSAEGTPAGQALLLLLDRSVVFHIGRKTLLKQVSLLPQRSFSSIFDLCDELMRKQSLLDQDIADIQGFLASLDAELYDFTVEFLQKTLRLGVTMKSLCKAFAHPPVKPEICMLAKKYAEHPEAVEGKRFAITEKLDGVRCVAYCRPGEKPVLLTRQGKPITGLTDIEETLQKVANAYGFSFMADGELLIRDRRNIPSKEQYKRTIRIVMSKAERKPGIVYNVFDLVQEKDKDEPYAERRHRLDAIFGSSVMVHPVPIQYIGDDTSMIFSCLDKERSLGHEGVMINLLEGKYVYGRTTNLLKVKVMQDADLRITGIREGVGKYAGTCGSIVVDYRGTEVGVGSGLTDELRREIWNNQEAFIGRVATIRYFEETTDANGVPSIRFPVFECLREAGKGVSYE